MFEMSYFFFLASRALTIARACSGVRTRRDFFPPLRPISARYLRSCVFIKGTSLFFQHLATGPTWLRGIFDLLVTLQTSSGQNAIFANWRIVVFVVNVRTDASAFRKVNFVRCKASLYKAIERQAYNKSSVPTCTGETSIFVFRKSHASNAFPFRFASDGGIAAKSNTDRFVLIKIAPVFKQYVLWIKRLFHLGFSFCYSALAYVCHGLNITKPAYVV